MPRLIIYSRCFNQTLSSVGVASIGSSDRGRALKVSIGLLELVLGELLKVLNSVTTVEVNSYLFICLYEDFEFFVKVTVLLFKDVNVLLEGSNLESKTVVSFSQAGI